MKQAVNYNLPSVEEALQIAGRTDLEALMHEAAHVRDAGFGDMVTFSRKLFIPLTHLCRDVCHYCTFAKPPRRGQYPFIRVEDVLASARFAAKQGCKEVLFTLGEKPELRYEAARTALLDMGFNTTLEYVAHVAGLVLKETGILPHINAGCMDAYEISMLRRVSASMGLMLESSARRLCEKGMPHYGSPDKDPDLRLETIRLAGAAKVPFTSGILVGIGETRLERVESLLALRTLHDRYGHLQEVIIQNFRAKPGTRMALASEPPREELLWTIAVARLILGPQMSLQAPPNLSPDALPQLIGAGINDWGGVSPVTPDYVNPEAPWPHIDHLGRESALAGKTLHERLTIYPRYVVASRDWVDAEVLGNVLRMSDAAGYPRADQWLTGALLPPPESDLALLKEPVRIVGSEISSIVERACSGVGLKEWEITRLFEARGREFAYICQAADRLRAAVNGQRVSYVVNRNINYTNVCTYKCRFCAFSKGKLAENLRGPAYDLDPTEISRRVREAWQRGATEVCMQGGIHPDYDGQTYLDILSTAKQAAPAMHVHAFSPLEVWQGATTLAIDLDGYLRRLRIAGLGSLPGTAAEILDDEVRSVLCPDKLSTDQWLAVIEAAHRVGFKTTATIMYGHIERPEHSARHLLRLRELQTRTGGFTEFVPLPFVATEAPIYLAARARSGPTFREAVLMHAVARLALHPLITNIQASWVKMGQSGVQACLSAGANDLGGTLMNESITRAAGALHGQELPPARMETLIRSCGREPWQRTTLYAVAPEERIVASYRASPLTQVINTPLRKRRVPQAKTADAG